MCVVCVSVCALYSWRGLSSIANKINVHYVNGIHTLSPHFNARGWPAGYMGSLVFQREQWEGKPGITYSGTVKKDNPFCNKGSGTSGNPKFLQDYCWQDWTSMRELCVTINH